VLGSVSLETALADSQVFDSCVANFANHLKFLSAARHTDMYLTAASLEQQSSVLGD
jgi:hypothetical protein